MGNFCLVQIFGIFVAWSLAAKIKTNKNKNLTIASIYTETAKLLNVFHVVLMRGVWPVFNDHTREQKKDDENLI